MRSSVKESAIDTIIDIKSAFRSDDNRLTCKSPLKFHSVISLELFIRNKCIQKVG